MSQEPLQFHEESPPDLDGYLPFDAGAVLAAILALLSVGSFWVPALMFFGIPAILLGWRASWLARTRRRAPIGMVLGTFALVIAGFSSMTGGGYQYFLRSHLARVADEQVQAWCGLLRDGKTYEAYELHQPYRDRQILGTVLEDFYKEDLTFGMPDKIPETDEERMEMQMQMGGTPPWQKYEMYFTSDPAKTLREKLLASDFASQVNYQGLVKLENEGPDTHVTLRYELVYQSPGGERRMPFLIEMIRSRYAGGTYHWQVGEIRAPAQGE